ncbi:MAG: peptide chain release factor N(5)-glutamine methyltransferase [Eubacteriales bacterium]|nr:peptide chain release factor N(5)-glutamine methyltransferase [Eubacteriales bacterium]
MTIQQALHWARRQSTALSGDPRWPSFLLADLLGVSTAQLLAAYAQQLPAAKQADYESCVRRVLSGEPLQYVLGHWTFFGREFGCDRRALIPREDTETLVRAVLDALPASPARVLDVGCGAGCIGITLKLERPGDDVALCDISAEALALAGENARALSADVALFAHDMRKPLPALPYDAIVSNPPYIAADEWARTDESVRKYEPHLALFAARNGLEYYHALACRARQSLCPGGILAVECGFAQAGKIKELFAPVCTDVTVHQDAAGIDRVILGRKNL